MNASKIAKTYMKTHICYTYFHLVLRLRMREAIPSHPIRLYGVVRS
jgi:hypothetical protein